MRHRELGAAGEPAIPDDNAPLPPARRPTRWTVRRGRTIAFALVGLALAASLASVYLTYRDAQESRVLAADVDRRLDVLEQDLAERTRQRDAERDAAAARAEADREQFRAHFCEVLTELSATFPNLDELRQALGCAPAPVPAAAPAAVAQPGVPDGAGPAVPASPSSAPSGPADRPTAPASTPAPAPPPSPPPWQPAPEPSLLCELLPLC